MSKEIRLALDLDGVVFDFNTTFTQLARNTFPGIVLPDVNDEWPDKWDYLDAFLTKKELRQLWQTIIHSPTFWSGDVQDYPHAASLLVAAQTADKLYYITSRSGVRVQWQTEYALQTILGNTMTGAVIAVHSPDHKIGILNTLECTHFVDDRVETIQDAWQQTECKIAIWDRPWNRLFADYPDVTRLKTVEDFETWLQ